MNQTAEVFLDMLWILHKVTSPFLQLTIMLSMNYGKLINHSL